MTKNQAIIELQTIFKLTKEQARRAVEAIAQNDDLDDDVYEIFFDFYCNNGEMPYGTAKASDGDPIEWVHDRIAEELGFSK